MTSTHVVMLDMLVTYTFDRDWCMSLPAVQHVTHITDPVNPQHSNLTI